MSLGKAMIHARKQKATARATAAAAVANAVEDALAPFGVKVTSLPITPEKVFKAVTETKLI